MGWACSLYSDLIGHWEKRNRSALADMDPENLDVGALRRLALAHGSPALVSAASVEGAFFTGESGFSTGGLDELDDFAACQIHNVDDIRALFIDRFSFGCEADDPITTWAFKPLVNRRGARLRAMFGSDIGHFDVVDMCTVVPEAYELVEHGLIEPEDFRSFVFTNAIEHWGGADPAFFEGTRVAGPARAALLESHK